MKQEEKLKKEDLDVDIITIETLHPFGDDEVWELEEDVISVPIRPQDLQENREDGEPDFNEDVTLSTGEISPSKQSSNSIKTKRTTATTTTSSNRKATIATKKKKKKTKTNK